MLQGSYRYRPVTQLSLGKRPLRHPSDVKFGSGYAGIFESELSGIPIIEIARDGKSAKALWTSLQANGKTHEDDPKPQATWLWWRNAIDFVIEDGEWEIWHVLRNLFFFAPYSKDWVGDCPKHLRREQ